MKPYQKVVRRVKAAVSRFAGREDVIDPLDAKAEGDAPYATDEETRLVRMIDARYQESRAAKAIHEDRYKLGYEFYRGNQWTEAKNGKVLSLRKDDESKRLYPVANKVRPNVRKHVSRALSARIDVSLGPLTSRPVDVQTTGQARGLLSHFAEIHDDDETRLRVIEHVCKVGPVAVLDYYDPDTIVPLPELDAQGQIVSIEDAAAGEVGFEIFDFPSLFPDPTARRPSELRWVITANNRTLSYVRERWSEIGQYLDADGGNGDDSARFGMESVDGKTNTPSTHEILVKTSWQLPVGRPDMPDFDPGHYIVIAGGRVLEDRPFPYEHMKGKNGRWELPFTWLWWETLEFSFWGDSAVTPLIGPQREINRLLQKIARHTANGDGKILAPMGCGIKADAFKSGEPNEIIYFEVDPRYGELVPKFTPTAQLDPAIPDLLDRLNDAVQEAAEVRDGSNGKAPFPGVSAAAIQALQEADQSTVALFVEHLKVYNAERARKRLAIARQYYVEPRLVMVQDSDNPDATARAEVFKEFGEGRYVVTAAASTPQSPATRIQTIMDLAQSGAFQPGNLATTQVLLSALGFELSDSTTEELQNVVAQAEKTEQDKADAEHQAEGERIAANTDAAMQQGGANPPMPPAPDGTGEPLPDNADNF